MNLDVLLFVAYCFGTVEIIGANANDLLYILLRFLEYLFVGDITRSLKTYLYVVKKTFLILKSCLNAVKNMWRKRKISCV